MQAAARRLCTLAALLLALATLMGALSVHAFKPHLSAEHYEALQTAVYYQFFHALGLMALGLLCDRVRSRLLTAAAWLVFFGVLGFSGSVYLLVLVAATPRAVGIVTPLSGLVLIAGWCLCALALWCARQGSGHGSGHG